MNNNKFFKSNGSIGWSEYNFDETNYSQIPPPKINGGLYTGEPFKKDAPYRNFDVIPDEGYLTTVNLQSADPPPGAKNQFTYTRPGNNLLIPVGVEKNEQYHITCTSVKK